MWIAEPEFQGEGEIEIRQSLISTYHSEKSTHDTNVKDKLSYKPNDSMLRFSRENICSHKNLYMNFYSNIIYISVKVKKKKSIK